MTRALDGAAGAACDEVVGGTGGPGLPAGLPVSHGAALLAVVHEARAATVRAAAATLTRPANDQRTAPRPLFPYSCPVREVTRTESPRFTVRARPAPPRKFIGLGVPELSFVYTSFHVNAGQLE
jgi:hypothetical protein